MTLQEKHGWYCFFPCSVPDVTKCEITSLKGLTYTDKVLGGEEVVEENDPVRVTGFTDRVYQGAPDKCVLKGLQGGRSLELTKV